jgi:hypothetical protein
VTSEDAREPKLNICSNAKIIDLFVYYKKRSQNVNWEHNSNKQTETFVSLTEEIFLWK